MNSCLICDDHAMLREALVGCVLAAWPDAAIIEASDFPSAWAAAATRPDFIMSDLAMPGAAPEAGIAGLLRAAGGVPVLVVTGNDDDALLLRLFDMGVAGFLPKSSRGAVIESAIRLIAAGERYVPPRFVALAAAQRDGTIPSAAARSASTAIGRLTNRQIDVLRKIALGQSNKEIARDFDLSPATVKAHAAAVFAALGAANRTEAVIKAQSVGLI